MPSVRAPAVAGLFYPGDPATLGRLLNSLLRFDGKPEPALGIVVPHAGYVYSGAIAGEVYARVVVPATAVILCPNHTGLGPRRSVYPSGSWSVPGAEVPVDAPLAAELIERAGLEPDLAAHRQEHAAEVQLPFLRARNPRVSVVPVCLSGLSGVECVALGEAVAEVLRPRLGEVLLVASTDLSHYLPAEEARTLDTLAVERVESIDPEGLHRVVREQEISMCGVVPTTVLLAAARALGVRRARLVRRGDSSAASGDFERVVGYAGLILPPP